MMVIDGSEGEGGGQVLRSALALSLLTGQPFRMEKIRAGRPKPGLMRQHLAAVKAAAAIGGVELKDLELRASELEFAPQGVRPGEYHFPIGSAGSACLVMQTVLPALLVAEAPSRLVIEGGTHTTYAPTFDFIERVFLPVLCRMGARVQASLERTGFLSTGGGRFSVEVRPVAKLAPIELMERGAVVTQRAEARVAGIEVKVATRELSVVRETLGWSEDVCHAVELRDAPGPGNVLLLQVESEGITELFSGIGERGTRAEQVGRRAAGRVKQYLKSRAPVGRYLADQLMIPCAMAGGGRYLTTELTQHSRTNRRIVERFLPVHIACSEQDGADGEVLIEVVPR